VGGTGVEVLCCVAVVEPGARETVTT